MDNVAVYWDFENIHASLAMSVLAKIGIGIIVFKISQQQLT